MGFDKEGETLIACGKAAGMGNTNEKLCGNYVPVGVWISCVHNTGIGPSMVQLLC